MQMTTPNRLGQHAGEAAASFQCAEYGEMAAVVKAVPAGRTADMGPPLGLQHQKQVRAPARSDWGLQ
jgi:hypothetical protein